MRALSIKDGKDKLSFLKELLPQLDFSLDIETVFSGADDMHEALRGSLCDALSLALSPFSLESSIEHPKSLWLPIKLDDGDTSEGAFIPLEKLMANHLKNTFLIQMNQQADTVHTLSLSPFGIALHDILHGGVMLQAQHAAHKQVLAEALSIARTAADSIEDYEAFEKAVWAFHIGKSQAWGQALSKLCTADNKKLVAALTILTHEHNFWPKQITADLFTTLKIFFANTITQLKEEHANSDLNLTNFDGSLIGEDTVLPDDLRKKHGLYTAKDLEELQSNVPNTETTAPSKPAADAPVMEKVKLKPGFLSVRMQVLGKGGTWSHSLPSKRGLMIQSLESEKILAWAGIAINTPSSTLDAANTTTDAQWAFVGGIKDQTIALLKELQGANLVNLLKDIEGHYSQAVMGTRRTFLTQSWPDVLKEAVAKVD